MDDPSPQVPAPQFSERSILFVVGAVQFVNILDFMMVMPLGRDFASDLHIPQSNLGYIGGSYTAAAAISGLVGAFILERFDRRTALVVAMAGLVLGTLSGAFAYDLPSLLAARVVAGAFGGPATAVSLSIIADVVPAERRGRAMGAVMGAFSVASVLGVPVGLELAHRFSWRAPFIGVSSLGAIIAAYAWFHLAPMRGHLATGRPPRSPLRELVSVLRTDTLLMLGASAAAFSGAFVLTPNITPYVLGNLEFPRERLGLLYAAGGVAAFFAGRIAGRLADRFGSTTVAVFATAGLATVIYDGFGVYPCRIPISLLFVGYMTSMTFRNLAYNTLASKVPEPHERARFTSLKSSVEHMASALGAFLSSRILSERPNKTLEGMPTVAAASVVLAMVVPPMLLVVERRTRRKETKAVMQAP